jgi:hypothetical protein
MLTPSVRSTWRTKAYLYSIPSPCLRGTPGAKVASTFALNGVNIVGG